MNCAATDLPAFVPELLDQLSKALEIDPLADIRVVAPVTTHETVKKVQDAIIAHFSKDEPATVFQGRTYHAGLPIVVRQPLESSDCPAFSVFWPEKISASVLTLRSVNDAVATVRTEDRIDVFDALVMTPKFVRGRRYELVILIALADQQEHINQELLSSLLNTTVRSLLVVGEIEQLAHGIADRQSSRTRSKLLDWVSEK
jgi:hypothetical protein